MIPRLLCILGLSLATLAAADPSPEDLLRQGLFEEEANRDFDKAAANYQAVIAAHDRQRAFAATATFRLGEIARKKNDKKAAAAAFRTVIERFPEQDDLARLSRENLAALGMVPVGEKPAIALTNDPEENEISKLKEIARNSPDLIDGADAAGWRPMHHAAKNGWTKVISYLLENRADPNSRTIKEQLTPLQLASVHGHLGAVNALLAAKADVNATFNIESVSNTVLPVADRRAKDAKGEWTALALAILYDRRETARALIEAGTDLKQVGPVIFSDELTALALAIYFRRNDSAQILIDAGSPLAPMGALKSITPLRLAVEQNPEMVAPLLKAGADPKLPHQFTPLHSAANQGRLEIAKLLIETGADTNAITSNGETPLHRAYTTEMIDFLVSKGADPNARTQEGLTPLDVAANLSTSDAIEALLKHGATVEDPIALLQRSSEPNLPIVRERIVYPREQRPNGIFLSVDGVYSFFNPEPPRTSGGRQPRPRVTPMQNRRDLITLETRPSPDSPPPSLAEALCEAFEASSYPQSIRILRRGANESLEVIREWSPSDGAAMPTDWPALKWGDIVEVRIYHNRSSSEASPTIGDFSAQIPTRTATFRLGDLEIPKTISGSATYWLDRHSASTLPKLIPNIEEIADLSHFVVHRKGAGKPIKLDFTESTETRFRLIDGDTIEMSFNLPELNRKFGDGDTNHDIRLFGHSRSGSFGGQSLIGLLSNASITPPVDFRKILILRRAENWKPEIVDIKAWLDALPPAEQWTQDALQASAPKLNPGDAVILVEDPAENATKSATELREKLKRIDEIISKPRPKPRPRVEPPPAQAH